MPGLRSRTHDCRRDLVRCRSSIQRYLVMLDSKAPTNSTFVSSPSALRRECAQKARHPAENDIAVNDPDILTSSRNHFGLPRETPQHLYQPPIFLHETYLANSKPIAATGSMRFSPIRF